jgi:hypothetical protein
VRTFADIVVNSTKVSFGQVLQVLFLAVAAIFFLVVAWGKAKWGGWLGLGLCLVALALLIGIWPW